MKDDTDRYGRVSRFLHWAMALLLLWQFLSAGAHLLLEDTLIEEFLWSTHKPMGFFLFIVIVIRIGWAVLNLSKRPPSISVPAKLGHIALYGIMIIIPSLALLREYGSGDPFEPFGIPLFAGFEGGEIAWMVDLGNLLHSWLGWTFLAMILGHIFMAFWHKRNTVHTDVMQRMWR